ncbi:MAG: YigZ family protein [Gemmatimonadaceae bacterium]
MASADRYRIPAARHRVEQTIDRSRFVCTVDCVATPEEAQQLLRELNAEFPDATHNCWAYVAGPPGSTSRIGMSDAGEPHGTAGRPMLTVLLHSGIGEIAAIVTRYYGGTKLGTGGLVKAYGGVVQLALETLPVTERVDYVDLTVTFGYASVTVAQQLLATFDAETVRQEYEEQVQYVVRVPRPSLSAFRAAMADATRGEAVVVLADN